MEKAYRGTKEVFYIQIFDAKGNHITTVGSYNVFPSPAELERSLVAATGVYGFGVSAKVDKRYVLDVIE